MDTVRTQTSDSPLRVAAECVPTTVGSMTVSELEARCEVLEPGIVLMREVPHGTAETYEVLIRRCNRLGAQFDPFVIVVDLTEVTERPKGRYLSAIRRALKGPAAHFAVTQPGSSFLRTVLAFVLGRMSDRTSVHPHLEAALAVARKLVR